MTDIMISHPRMALTLTEAMKGQCEGFIDRRRASPGVGGI